MCAYYDLREEFECVLNDISVAEIIKNPVVADCIKRIEEFFGHQWG